MAAALRQAFISRPTAAVGIASLPIMSLCAPAGGPALADAAWKPNRWRVAGDANTLKPCTGTTNSASPQGTR
jgi:hypothetical protein